MQGTEQVRRLEDSLASSQQETAAARHEAAQYVDQLRTLREEVPTRLRFTVDSLTAELPVLLTCELHMI